MTDTTQTGGGMSHKELLTFERIGKLGGGEVALHIDKAIRRARLDIEKHPTYKAARVITLTLSLAPTKTKGHLKVKTSVGVRLPPGKAETLAEATADRNGDVLFNPLSATHLDQQPLPFEPAEPLAPEPPEAAPKPAGKRRGKKVTNG